MGQTAAEQVVHEKIQERAVCRRSWIESWSMQFVNTRNIPITGAIIGFPVDIFMLIQSCNLPINYPPTLDLNIEDVLQVIFDQNCDIHIGNSDIFLTSLLA